MIATISDDAYTGLEAAVNEVPPSVNEFSDIIYIRPPNLSSRAVPVFDTDLYMVTGYVETMSGISRIYDLDGTMVRMEELPLEAPPFGPEDIIFLIGGLARFGFKTLFRTGIRAFAVDVSKATLYILRERFRILKPLGLKFTHETIVHMKNPKRFVPVQILMLAIKHSKKIPDPQAAVGAVKYVTKMVIMTKKYPQGKEYVLHVVVRESDQTILHFHYD
jgi:hypothetical protein